MIETLFVDDEESFLDLAKTYLEKQNEDLEVETISSPTKALKLINENGFDCIVCDYQMPELDGLEVLKKVRKDLGSDVPFIMFTGKGREEVAMEALNNGADRYLKKGGDLKTQFGVLADAIRQEYSHWFSEKKLRRSEKEKSLILKNLEEIVAYHDTNHRLLWANKAYAEATEKNVEEMKGKKCYEIWLDRKKPCPNCPVDEALESGETEERELSPPGEPDIWLIRGIPVRDKSDNIIGVIETTKNITERKEAEKKLKKERRRFREIFNNANDAIYLHELTEEGLPGEFIEVNDVACKMLGYSRKEFQKMTPREIDAGEEADKILEVMEELVEEGDVRFEMKHKAKDGAKIPVEIHSHLFELEGKKRVLSIARDITERREREKRRKTLASSLDKASLEIYWIKPNGKFAYTNKKVRKKLGYTRKELKNMNVWDVDPKFPKEDRKDHWNKLKQKKSITFESQHQKKDGETYPVEITSHHIKVWEQEYEFAFAKDITERREAREREDFFHSLLRHDVQNKNQVVEGYLDLLEEELDEPREYLEKAKQACKSSQDIIQKVRTLREVEKEEPKEIELKPVIQEVLDKKKTRINKNGFRLIENCSLEDCKVRAGSLLKELFDNLIKNAIKHSNGNKIKISGKEKKMEKGKIKKCVITVEDDGKGIPDEKKEKVFEKGYKHGDSGETGLGLYLVKEIIEKYGGKVEAGDSDLGGARFDVYLQKA